MTPVGGMVAQYVARRPFNVVFACFSECFCLPPQSKDMKDR